MIVIVGSPEPFSPKTKGTTFEIGNCTLNFISKLLVIVICGGHVLSLFLRSMSSSHQLLRRRGSPSEQQRDNKDATEYSHCLLCGSCGLRPYQEHQCRKQ